MRLWQFNRRPKDDTPEMEHVLLQIASDIAIAITPFEDKERARIIEIAMGFAESGNYIREMYRAVEKDFEQSLL